MWTSELQEALNGRKRADTAFKTKDFNTAIESYTTVSNFFFFEFASHMMFLEMSKIPFV